MTQLKNNDTDRRTNSFGHGGNIHHHRRIAGNRGPLYDFSANINPLGPPDWLRSLINRELENLVHYPDPQNYQLKIAAANYHGVDPDLIIPANGTTELLYLLPFLFPSSRVILPVPSYIDYGRVFTKTKHKQITFPLKLEELFDLNCDRLAANIQEKDLIIIGSPNNPTGRVVDPQQLLALADRFPSSWFVIDEAFLDFTGKDLGVGGLRDNIITLNSMTKFYAIPGLRIGYGVFPAVVADSFRKKLPPWSVNHLAQVVGERCLADIGYQEKSRENLKELRSDLMAGLQTISSLSVVPSSANYMLINLGSGKSVHVLQSELQQRNILIRVCDNYEGLDSNTFRVAVRTKMENEYLIQNLTSVLKPEKSVNIHPVTEKARSLMFQGTASNAGKSVLTAALCRILLQDGVRVAPFKAQNMSLNSFVTLDGLEMGRAQVVQAQAARLDPDVRMNPVLLKPNSDTGSQVIINGQAVGNMSVANYHKYKQTAMAAARRSYDQLASEYDVIVLEGAGSPGEVNLKKNDFVNMAMAEYAGSPVLLVGDIDRGGVYASFIGTMDVLDERERQLIAGFVVNRFRGDASLLEDAHRYVKEYTGRDVLGTIPYLHDLGLPEEDSVSFKAGLFDSEKPKGDSVDLALINLGHISNFTDLEPFLDEPDVHLRVVSTVEDLGNPDCIVLPGSKNVIDDLLQLKENGLFQAVLSQSQQGCEIVGICGGYQMLGKQVSDPGGIESSKQIVSGLGLLSIHTTFFDDKTLVRKKGVHLESGIDIHGYEIHHGQSPSKHEPLLSFDDNSFCGTASENGLIWGTYLHGIFDADLFRRWFINRLRVRKKFEPINRTLAPYDLEPAFDRLADCVRSTIDMDHIYRLLKL